MARNVTTEWPNRQQFPEYAHSEVDKFLQNPHNVHCVASPSYDHHTRRNSQGRQRDGGYPGESLSSPRGYSIGTTAGAGGVPTAANNAPDTLVNSYRYPQNSSAGRKSSAGNYFGQPEYSESNYNQREYPEYKSSGGGSNFNRSDKSRKSTVKSAVSVLLKMFSRSRKPSRETYTFYTNPDDSSLSSSNSMRRSRSSYNFQRNQSFSASMKRVDPTKSNRIPNIPTSEFDRMSIHDRSLPTSPTGISPSRPSRTRSDLRQTSSNVPMSPVSQLQMSQPPKIPPKPIAPPRQSTVGNVFQKPPPMVFRPSPCNTGIMNTGNSCYMNSVLQSLACCDKLAQLFVSDNYKKYIHYNRSGNLLVDDFATVLKGLWFNVNMDNIMGDFIHSVGMFNAQFASRVQQDAHEFMIWLLDKIHEELRENASGGSNMSYKNRLHRSEEELADDAMMRHNDGSHSVIMKLFCAQFRSSIECVNCDFRNLSFDPFHSVSLTVSPDNATQIVQTVFVPAPKEEYVERFAVKIRQNTTIRDFIAFMSTYRIHIREKDCIVVLATAELPLKIAPLNTVIPPLFQGTLYILLTPSGVTNQLETEEVIAICSFATGNGINSRRHGYPFISVLPKTWSYDLLLRGIIESGVDQTTNNTMRHQSPHENCRIVVSDINDGAILDPSLSLPLLSHNVEPRIMLVDGRGPFLMLTVKFRNTFAENFFKKLNYEPYPEQLIMPYHSESMTLVDLLHDFVHPEELDWKCPNCSKNIGKKQLKFFSAPPILIFHLKRFHMDELGVMKRAERMIKIPLEGLDMSSFICRPDSQPSTLHRKTSGKTYNGSNYLSNGSGGGSTFVPNDNVYDLVSVVHHYGRRINSGHYTATTRNPIDGKWRTFDDCRVINGVDSREINLSSSAYLLFYQKRRPPTEQRAQQWFSTVPEFIDHRPTTRLVPTSSLSNGYDAAAAALPSSSSGIRTLPRSNFTSYVADSNGYTSPTQRYNSYISDRSKSYQNLTNSFSDNDMLHRSNF